jgi:hypothetical protein
VDRHFIKTKEKSMSTEKPQVMNATILRVDRAGTRRPSALSRDVEKALSTSSDPLREAMVTVDDILKTDAAYANREQGLLAHIFRSDRQKRLDEHDLSMTSIVAGAKERSASLATDVAYQDLLERANAWLTNRRIEARAHVVDSATEAVQTLKFKIEERREQFRCYVRLRNERLEAARDLELLFDIEAEDLRTELQQHYAFLRELEALFRNAVQERLR